MKSNNLKLRNRKTGKIGELSWHAVPDKNVDAPLVVYAPNDDGAWVIVARYSSVSELYREWEDYTHGSQIKPKNGQVCYGIGFDGDIYSTSWSGSYDDEKSYSIGNRFIDENNARDAREKLKALKTLRNYGFRVIDWEIDDKSIADGKIWFDLGGFEMSCDDALKIKEVKDAMNLLFNGDEDETTKK